MTSQFAMRPAGRSVRLRTLLPTDYQELYVLNSDPEVLVRWRHRGTTPSMEQFVTSLWADTKINVVAHHQRTQDLVGHFSLYGVDDTNGTGAVSVLIAPKYQGQPQAAEANVLFYRYIFDCLPIRKVYLQTPACNLHLFRSAVGPFFVEEGVLGCHEYRAGEFQDVHILALYRETVDQLSGIATGDPGARTQFLRESRLESLT